MNPGAEHVDEPSARPLRSDAERNRTRIIAAARRLLGRGGVSVSMASVARDAGAGIATLAAAAAAALDDPDPWHGLVGFLESVCAMQAADYGFADVLTITFPTAKALEERRREVHESVARLIDRAKAAGRLREDFTPEDLVLVYMANAGDVNATGQDALDAWRRFVALEKPSAAKPCAIAAAAPAGTCA
jgi:hypothetical protein